jgi:hypothetical protein
MAALDFTEIPDATGGTPGQDKFEQFARDLLVALGLTVVEGPDRGADGGRDLIASEKREGVIGATERRWLVSCKHKAHGGQSVTPTNEQNIRDRVEANGCTGFLGIYSTLPSSGLAEILAGLQPKIEVKVLDGEQLETILLKEPSAAVIARRYFPKSFAAWGVENPEAAKLYANEESLYCAACKKDLLEPTIEGNICFVSRYPDTNKLLTVYCSCKEHDYALQQLYSQRFGATSSWQDLRDLATPVLYIRTLMGFINRFRNKELEIDDNAFKDLKTAMLIIFTRVSRHQNAEDRERVEFDLSLPPGL